MASDVIDEEGRYRGFDVEDEEDTCNADTSEVTSEETKCAADICVTTVVALQRTIEDQALTIAKLQEQLTKYADEKQNDQLDTYDEDIGDTGEQHTKKRKRDGHFMENDMDTALVDSSNKDIRIQTLTEENIKLKEQLATEAQKLSVDNNSTVNKLLEVPPFKSLAAELTESKTMQTLENNPSLSNITTLIQDMQTTMKTQIYEMKESIQASIEEKIEKTCHEMHKKTYASTVVGKDVELRSTTNASRNNDFRSVMMNTKNEELAEENEKKARSLNFIIHGKNEVSEDEDEQFVQNLFTQLTIGNIKAKSKKRIGTLQTDKKRPILVQLQSEDDKSKVMNNLKNLKDAPQFHRISITDDYTLAEREMIKEFWVKAKKINDENIEEDTIYRVRGCPKNGLYLKKMKKQIQ